MKKILAASLVLIIAPLLFLKVASAQLLTNTTDPGGLDNITATVATQANFGKVSLEVVISKIVQIVLGVLGVIFLVLIIISGFRWMTAAGNEEQIKAAKSTLTNALIGLILVLAAYSLTYFIFKYIPFGGGGMPSAV